jgi:hypothetical protein
MPSVTQHKSLLEQERASTGVPGAGKTMLGLQELRSAA